MSDKLTTGNPIAKFDFEGLDVRVRDQDGEPWFVLADVCNALEVVNAAHAATRLDEDEKGIAINDTPSGRQAMTIINESGLYSLILTSRKPAAKRFKKWVTSEVLPALRRTGRYEVAAPAAEPPKLSPEVRQKINRVAHRMSRPVFEVRQAQLERLARDAMARGEEVDVETLAAGLSADDLAALPGAAGVFTDTPTLPAPGSPPADGPASGLDAKDAKAWLDVVREAEKLYGLEGARAAWDGTPLPKVGRGDMAKRAVSPAAVTVAEWFSERVSASPGSRVATRALFDAYCGWCERRGVKAVTHTAFGRAVKALGVERHRESGGDTMYWDIEVEG